MNMMSDVMQRTAGLRRPVLPRSIWLTWLPASDGFFETGLSVWDVAAGSLLVTEAGGLIGNFTGEADFMEQRECMAGNPRVYGQLVPILGKYSKFASAGDKASPCARLPLKTTLPGAPALLKKSPPTPTHQQARATHRSEPMS